MGHVNKYFTFLENYTGSGHILVCYHHSFSYKQSSFLTLYVCKIVYFFSFPVINFLYLEDKEHGRQHPKLDDLSLLVLFCLFVLYLELGTILGFLTFPSCKLVISYSNFDGLLVLRHGFSPSFSLIVFFCSPYTLGQ